jgi:hypothetical protein
MKNLNIKYEPVTADDVGMVEWNESLYKGTPVYIGLVNDFIVAVCTEHSGIEYDAIAIRFRLRRYEFVKEGKAKSKAAVTIYRHGYLMSDLKEGLWLTQDELSKINNGMYKLLDEFKMDFIGVK